MDPPVARRLLVLGLLNLAVVGTWIVSRTLGLPFGDAAGSAEDVAFPDALATALEGLVVLGSSAMLAGDATKPRLAAAGRARRALLPLVTAVTAVAATGAALSPRFASGHDHAAAADATGGHEHDRGGEAVARGATVAAGATDSAHSHGEESGNVGVQNADQAAELQPDQPLDAGTRAVLAMQLSAARTAAMRYPTLADATAAGLFPAGEFTPGAGAHYLSPGGAAASFIGGGGFDAANPATWLYDGMSPTSKVVVLMWISGEEEAPDGFAGPNDHWHRHFNTCIRSGRGGIAGIEVPFAADRDVTEQMCTEVGGAFMESTVWMVHAWVVPSWESPNGV